MKTLKIIIAFFLASYCSYSFEYINSNRASSSEGLDALFSNPANLRDTNFTFSFLMPLANIEASFGNTFMDIEKYNKYFIGDGTTNSDGSLKAKHLTESEKQDLSSIINNGEVYLNGKYTPLAFTINAGKIGTFGFDCSANVMQKIRFSNNISNLIDGYVGEKPIDLNNAQLSGIAYTSYGFAYANEISFDSLFIKKIAIGAKYNVLRGYYLMELEKGSTAKFTPFIPAPFDSVRSIALDLNYAVNYSDKQNFKMKNFFNSFIGKGHSIDFGVNVLLDPNICYNVRSVSALVSNIGGIDWDKGAITRKSSHILDTLKGVVNIDDSFSDKYTPIEEKLDSYHSDLPSYFSLSASVYANRFIGWDDPLLFNCTYLQELNDAVYNNNFSKFAFGFEYKSQNFVPSMAINALIGGYEKFGLNGFLGINLSNSFQIGLDGSLINLLGGLKSSRNANFSLRILFRG